MTREYGWSRTVVSSGNATGKLLVGPLFGFVAGWMIDRYGPRRMMIYGSLMMGVSLVGLSFSSSLPMFYLILGLQCTVACLWRSIALSGAGLQVV